MVHCAPKVNERLCTNRARAKTCKYVKGKKRQFCRTQKNKKRA